MASQSCPPWAKGVGQLVWDSIGVVIWDKAMCKVCCLSPHQTLDVLDDLRESSVWNDNPFYLRWNSYSMPFSEENRKEWRTTKNRRDHSGEGDSAPDSMTLTPEQTQELFLFLEKREDEIRTLADAHTKEVKSTLGRVYAFLIDLGRKRLARNENNN